MGRYVRGKERRGGYQGRIERIIDSAMRRLKGSYRSVTLDNLTFAEARKIKAFFDGRSEFEARRYYQEDKVVLKIYPVENLKKLSEEKAREVLEKGESVSLPPMGSYERYLVHNFLKDWKGIETQSFGEGTDRRVEIRPQKFGRSLKRIIKKIKLFR